MHPFDSNMLQNVFGCVVCSEFQTNERKCVRNISMTVKPHALIFNSFGKLGSFFVKREHAHSFHILQNAHAQCISIHNVPIKDRLV